MTWEEIRDLAYMSNMRLCISQGGKFIVRAKNPDEDSKLYKDFLSMSDTRQVELGIHVMQGDGYYTDPVTKKIVLLISWKDIQKGREAAILANL
ncbi:MAG: hypothetical protein ACI83D_000484 [Planctomycetota bacterium]|jgi:hypothetical protein